MNNNLQQKWNEAGEKYTREVNEMVDFAKKHGWDAWENLKKPDPTDPRYDLAPQVFELLKKANLEGKIKKFRQDFPPSHEPFQKMFEEKSQNIGHICFIGEKKIAFLAGNSWEKTNAYLLDDENLTELNPEITAIGKSKKENIFATAFSDKIIITKGWEGEILQTFERKITANLPITELLSFNDGKKYFWSLPKGFFSSTKTRKNSCNTALKKKK